MEEVTSSLNNPFHYRVELFPGKGFFGVSVDPDIMQLKILWESGMSSVLTWLRKGESAIDVDVVCH